MITLWALVGPDNIVVAVQSASQDWVDSWHAENPGSEFRYLSTDIEARDYAGIGFSWDETRGRFIPPMPTDPGTWVYDDDEWTWVNLDPPPVEE